MVISKEIREAIRKTAKYSAIAKGYENQVRDWMIANNIYNDSFIDTFIDSCLIGCNPEEFISLLGNPPEVFLKQGNTEDYA